MKSLILVLVLLTFTSLPLSHSFASASPIWLQTGILTSSMNNSGANVTIETVLGSSNQNSGSPYFSFWIGEFTTNGGFVQVGYTRFFKSNQAYPFFQAWDSKLNITSNFICTCTAGSNNTWHRYSMISTNGYWSFYFDNQLLGKVDASLVNGSHANSDPVSAIAEEGDTFSLTDFMPRVGFEDISILTNSTWTRATQASYYSSFSTNDASSTPAFGFEENTAYGRFTIGAGLPHLPYESTVWNFSNPQLFQVEAFSQFASAQGSGLYLPGDYASISLNSTRLRDSSNNLTFSFARWKGNAYNGSDLTAIFKVNSSIQEEAFWNITNNALSTITTQRQIIENQSSVIANQSSQIQSLSSVNQLLNASNLAYSVNLKQANREIARLQENNSLLSSSLKLTNSSNVALQSQVKSYTLEIETLEIVLLISVIVSVALVVRKRR